MIQISDSAVIEKLPDLDISCDLCADRLGELLLSIGHIDMDVYSVCAPCALSLAEALKEAVS